MWRERTNAAVFVPDGSQSQRGPHSERLIQTTTRLRVSARVHVEPHPGAPGRVNLWGMLFLNGPHARLMFRKAAVGQPDSSTHPLTADIGPLPRAPQVEIPARALEIEAASRPYLWVEFRNVLHVPFSRAICLGRVDRRPLEAGPVFELPACLSVWLGARDVTARRGPVVSLLGELSIPEGLCLRARFAGACDRLGEPAGCTGEIEFPVIPRGTTIQVPQRIVTPGAAGNPWVSLLVGDRPSGGIDDEMQIGRCVRIH